MGLQGTIPPRFRRVLPTSTNQRHVSLRLEAGSVSSSQPQRKNEKMNVAMEGPRNSCARIEKRASHLSVAHSGRARLSISCWLRVIYHKNTHARTFAGLIKRGRVLPRNVMSCPNVLSLGVNSELSFGCGYRIQATSARRVGARRSNIYLGL